ncbi:MAG TPA: FHA domain-containing protein [Pyrinomonadaceae bacterium]|nr:FHA domain-containing protein [Pyrinomonadaceae bacterium]
MPAGFSGPMMRIRLSARYQWEDTHSPPFFDQTFNGPRITIGNSPTANLSLNGSVRSGEQIVILLEETEPQIINQAEGTALNGEILGLNLPHPLKDGDLLTIGTYQINIAFERSNSPKSFAAILDSLRTDEDRFYFVIDDGTGSGSRIPIEVEEMPLGWDETGEYFCFDISSIVDLCAVVRKDWSGVMLRAQSAFGITVNGEPVEDERRLRDGDRIALNPPARNGNNTPLVLTFHEPTSLVILDTVMPRVAHEDHAASATEIGPHSAGQRAHLQKPMQKLAALLASDREYISVFTFLELTLMVSGTILGAIIIFLFLNYS